MFGCRFQDQPIVAYGHSLDGLQLIAGSFPRCFGGVRQWIKDERDLSSARTATSSSTSAVPSVGSGTRPSDDPVPPTVDEQAIIDAMVITHDFTFTAIALKTLPEELLQRA